jgi:hypothetical protein
MDFDTTVKLYIYKKVSETTAIPDSIEIASWLDCPIHDVESSFVRLHEKKLAVPEPSMPSKLRMAPPFSGIATQHVVQIGNKSYFANCAWDAFGISAALHADADISSACGDCKSTLTFKIRNGKPERTEGVVHFGVPAAHWWDDIIFT